MSEPIYVARAEIEKVRRVHRRARLETGEVLDLGVQGPIMEHDRLHPETETPLPVDFIAAAAGGMPSPQSSLDSLAPGQSAP